MAKVKTGVLNHTVIDQVFRHSRPAHVNQSNDITKCMEPINIWSHNLSVIKKQKDEKEKTFQR